MEKKGEKRTALKFVALVIKCFTIYLWGKKGKTKQIKNHWEIQVGFKTLWKMELEDKLFEGKTIFFIIHIFYEFSMKTSCIDIFFLVLTVKDLRCREVK